MLLLFARFCFLGNLWATVAKSPYDILLHLQDFTSYQGSPIENPYDGGISQISMSFVSQQVLQYKEEYSVTTSALVVNLIVSTGTLLSC